MLESAFLLILYIDPGNGPWHSTVFETYALETTCEDAGKMFTIMTKRSMANAGKAPESVWFECRPVKRRTD